MTTDAGTGARVIPIWTLPDRIRKAREHAGLSQQELADELSVTRTSVINWERGHTRPLRVILYALADLTRVEREWLAGDEWAARDSNSEPMDSSPDGVSTAELKTEFLRNIGLSGVTPARSGRPRHRAGVA